MSFVQGMATQIKRFACDRCHGQKLRCPRPADGGDPTVPCMRCQKAGKACNISSPLKTGRPSKALKLQARAERRSSSTSPPLSRTSSNNTVDFQTLNTPSTTVSDFCREERTHHTQSPREKPTSYDSNMFGGQGNFQVCSETPQSLLTKEHQYANFNVDVSGMGGMGDFGTTGGKEFWSYTLPQDYPMTKSKSTNQTSLPSHGPFAFDPFYYDTHINVHMNKLQGCIAENDFNYSSQYFPDHIPIETTLEQGCYGTAQVYQGPGCIRSDMENTLENQIMIWPSPVSNTFHQDTIEINEGRRPSGSKSLSTLSDSDSELTVRDAEEIHRTQSMLQLQMDIYDCSATIIHAGTVPQADTERCRNQFVASKMLLDVSERFIKFMTITNNTPNLTQMQAFTTSSLQPAPTATLNVSSPALAKDTCFSLKRGASPLAADGSFNHFNFDNSAPRSRVGSSNTAFFHLMMGCYTRLLVAFDKMVERIGITMSDASHPARRSSAASLSKPSATENDTVLETRLHLEAISRQLSKLNNALRGALLSSQGLRQSERYSRKISVGNLHQARRSLSPSMLEESAMEVVEEQERMLQVKIKEIKSLSGKPQRVRKSRARFDA